jgi:hypothetical protein
MQEEHETAPVSGGGSMTDRLLRIHALLDDLTSSPWSHDVLELALGVVLSLRISEADESALVWLMIVGPPSDGKTATVLLLKTAQGVYCVDTVTENFLASGYRDEKTGKSAPDLFKELDGKCVVIKEFGTVLSLRADKVRKFLGDLQAIYDREYSKATGTVGTIRGKAAFSILACATPATLHDHQQYMARIGPRFLTYRAPDLTEAEEEEGLEMFWEASHEARKKVLVELRQLVAEHLAECMDRTFAPSPETREQKRFINRLAQLVADGRTDVRFQKIHDVDTGVDRYASEISQVEKPFRVQQQLRNLSRSLALVHGRDRMTDHELELLRRVALSSLPADRAAVLALFPDHEEGITAKACGAAIGKSDDRARQILEDLVLIKLLVRRTGKSQGGVPAHVYAPVPRMAEFLTVAFKPLDHVCDLAETLPISLTP